LAVRKESGGFHVGMDNKENKNRAKGTVGTQMKGPMDSYVIPQQKKSAVSSGKFLTACDSGFAVKFGSSKHKTGPGMKYHNIIYPTNILNTGHRYGTITYTKDIIKTHKTKLNSMV
jgi:hypothetical protein